MEINDKSMESMKHLLKIHEKTMNIDEEMKMQRVGGRSPPTAFAPMGPESFRQRLSGDGAKLVSRQRPLGNVPRQRFLNSIMFITILSYFSV